jgi:hypothetical protein
LHTFRDQIDQLGLFFGMLIKQQVIRVESRPWGLPLMLLVSVPRGYRVGEKLVQTLDAGGSHRHIQGQQIPAGQMK